MSRPQQLVDSVREIWNAVCCEEDISPRNPVINSSLSELVDRVMRSGRTVHESSAELVCDGYVNCEQGAQCPFGRERAECCAALRQLTQEGLTIEIRGFCQRCEYSMECFWAQRIVEQCE